jgi:hypothetical protein
MPGPSLCNTAIGIAETRLEAARVEYSLEQVRVSPKHKAGIKGAIELVARRFDPRQLYPLEMRTRI